MINREWRREGHHLELCVEGGGDSKSKHKHKDVHNYVSIYRGEWDKTHFGREFSKQLLVCCCCT